MQSGIRVFKKNNFGAKGRLISLDKFKLFSDMTEMKIDDEKATAIIEKAEQFLEEPLTVITLSLFRDKFITGSRSNYERVHHRRRDMLFYMTLAEIYEDKGRFTEKIADVAWAIMEEASWVIPAHQGNSLMDPATTVPEIYEEADIPGADLYSSICGSLLGFVKYFLKDKLDAISPVICKRINHLVYLRTIRPYVVGDYWWMQSSCNWLPSVTMNTLMAAATCCDDMPLRERVVSKALILLDDFISKYPEDGCCAEGPFYWDGAAGSLFDCLEIIEDLTGGVINVYHEPIIKNMCEFISTMIIDGRRCVNFEDANNTLHLYGDMIKRMGDKLGSEALSTLGVYGSYLMRGKTYVFFGMPYRAFKDACTPTVYDATKVKGKLSAWLDGHKIAVFRECEDTGKGLFLATKGGTNGEPGNHNDIGCLVVYSNAKPVIVDPGIGSYNNDYFGDTRYLRWYTNASYHSCPVINGYEQEKGRGYASSDEVCDVDNRSVSMNIGGAYPDEAGIVSLVRSSSLTDGKITVTDEVKLRQVGKIIFCLTSSVEPTVISEGKLLLADNRILSYNKDLSLSVSKIENTNKYEDIDVKGLWGVDNLYRIELSVRACEYKCNLVVE
jgi:hypothetical protein